MDFIEILNYQPFGGMRVMHYIMLFIVIHVVWLEVKVYLNNRE